MFAQSADDVKQCLNTASKNLLEHGRFQAYDNERYGNLFALLVISTIFFALVIYLYKGNKNRLSQIHRF